MLVWRESTYVWLGDQGSPDFGRYLWLNSKAQLLRQQDKAAEARSLEGELGPARLTALFGEPRAASDFELAAYKEPPSQKAIIALQEAIALRAPQFSLAVYAASKKLPADSAHSKVFSLPGTYTELITPGQRNANKYMDDLKCLARTYQANGQMKLAEDQYKKSLAINENALGHENELTAGNLNQLGWIYYKQQHYVEAEVFAQEAIKIGEHDGMLDHYPQAMVLRLALLEKIYQDSGAYAKAEPVCKREISLLEEDKETDAGFVKNRGRLLANVLENYARLLTKMHRGADANITEARARELHKING